MRHNNMNIVVVLAFFFLQHSDDVNSYPYLTFKAWKTDNLTFSIDSYPKDSTITRNQIHQVLKEAFREWTQYTPLHDVREVAEGKGIIRIGFFGAHHGDNINFTSEVYAHAYYPGSTDVNNIDGDLHFYDRHNFCQNSDCGGETTDFRFVALHELGHIFGLFHTTDEGTIMYEAVPMNARFEDVSVTKSDIRGIQALYPDPKLTKLAPFNRTIANDFNLQESERSIFSFCDGSGIDEILEFSAERLMFFKDDHMWIVKAQEDVFRKDDDDDTCNVRVSLKNNFRYDWLIRPMPFAYYWKDLGPDGAGLKKIDAAFKRRSDNNILIISDNRFWLMKTGKYFYDTVFLTENFPLKGRPLTDLGLPKNVTKVDTIFRWENDNIYLFSGELYWLYIEKDNILCPKDNNDHYRIGCIPQENKHFREKQRMGSYPYPRLISDFFHDLRTPIHSVHYMDNKTYIIYKDDDDIYELDNIIMRLNKGERKKLVYNKWTGCSFL